MGLLRRVARKVVSNLRGAHAEPASGPALPSAAPQAAPAPAAAPAAAPVVAEADALATLDCGAQELKERLDAGEEVLVVDVRPALEGGTLPGARHLPLAELEARWQELADADEIVCADADGSTSAQAARLLRARGLINATSLDGGIAAWRAVGGAVVRAGGAG